MNEKPKVQLSGENGNVYAIIGACRKSARKAGWSDGRWQVVQSEMMSGDYDKAIQTAIKYFEVL